MVRNAFLIVLVSLIGVPDVLAQSSSKITREAYIDKYSDLAMKEMKRTGIPASITLAQGCLESDNGNSSLSVDGNNHFGIKCHDWQGAKMYHDDDEKGECFRKYKSAYESYVDHSMFLTKKSRYAFLFDLKPGDYKGWARGLQKAGYATSNKYASLLIKIIEENELQAYDNMVLDGEYKPGRLLDKEAKPGRTDEVAASTSRTIYLNNRIEYIIAENGDTPALLREELELYPGEIYRYNDLDRGSALDSGMVLYLQPKRLRAEKGSDTHVIKEGESIRDISQRYGVKIKSIYWMNNLERGVMPDPGTKLNLRKKVRVEKQNRTLPIRKKPMEEEDEEGGMQFEFDGS